MGAAVAVGGDVKGFVVVQEFEHVRRRWGIYDRSRYQLIHCFVVRGFRGVMHKTGTTAVNGTGKESHADGFLVRNSLESANQVSSLKILRLV